jgi:hypothetical protein
MTGWLQQSLGSSVDAPPLVLAWRIGVALLLGGAVAGIYRWARRGEAVSATFLTTLVLLAALIAMATQIIGDNVARAFSLVGALSVVRFRTVVKDTQDTAFVIFAVVVGMASGANHLAVGLVGLVLLVVAAPALWPRRGRTGWEAETLLTIRVPGGAGARVEAERLLEASTHRFELMSVGTVRQGTALELSYRILLRSGGSPADLVSAMNGLEGVENASLHREE